MAEAVLFSLTGKLLGELSSKTLKEAYGRVQSNRNARKELDKLEETIGSIHLVVLDAEKKHEDSPPVKDWIRRVRDVLYEADDLCDDVFAADALLQEGNKVVAIFSRIISNDDIAKRVKAIRESLDGISHDMKQFNFIHSQSEIEVRGLRKTAETRPFVDEKVVFGREDEKKAIIELLLSEDAAEKSMPVQVIAIVGIGGMGKTTLAQLVYKDEQVTKMFEKKWWTCISDVPGKAHVLGRISGSMVENCDSSNPEELICKAVSSSGKYLLVLDDVWDFENNDAAMWHDIMSLLGEGTAGSKILVTTRFSSVPRDMHKDKSQIYDLHGLSEEKSWQLFKAIAFTEEQENSSEWVSIGKEILSKCVNVPLAIKSIAGLLRTKYTLGEWEAFKDKELSKMKVGEGSIMHALKLSYNHLPSDLKNCFAYCSLFPKDSKLRKQQLIHLWIAQGYCMPKDETETPEGNGHVYFMELLKRCFFQEVEEYDGEIYSCQMHDLIHDLAQDVAREESIVLVEGGSRQLDKKIRHLSVAGRLCDSWDGPPPELKAERRRSLIFMLPVRNSFVLDQRVMKFKSLRTLSLQGYKGRDVPSCIGELRHLRYLNLSKSIFQDLPDSITKLVNLLTLDLHRCEYMKALPDSFRKLISLRHLDISECRKLKHMPLQFGELTCLQQLSDFKVCKRGSGLDSLANMSLQGDLSLLFDEDDVAMEETIQIPHTLKGLGIFHYPGMRVSTWWKEDLSQLVKLRLSNCKRVKHLPPLRCLPLLKDLVLYDFEVLEYIEDGIFSITPFFPSLRTLELFKLPKLKRWSEEYEEHPQPSFFPHLALLDISHCPGLDSMPRSPYLERLHLYKVGEKIVHQLVSTSNASLQKIMISSCHSLKSIPGEGLTSLHQLDISHCPDLDSMPRSPYLEQLYLSEVGEKIVHQLVSTSNASLQKIMISSCHSLKSIPGEGLTSLHQLHISHCPDLDSMPRSPYLEQLHLCKVGEKIVHQLVSTSNASLQHITIRWCDSLKSFLGEGLTSLRSLELDICYNLEKVQLSESNTLQTLILRECPKLELIKCSNLEKVQLDNEEHPDQSFFPHLTLLRIISCPVLDSMPRWQYLEKIDLTEVGEKIVHQVVSTANASLQSIGIRFCDSLKSFPGDGLTSLRELRLSQCYNLETVQLASNALQELLLNEYPKVELWGHIPKEEERGLHWASLTNLRRLFLDEIPQPKQLPHCLRNRTALGKLKILKCENSLWF